MGAMVGRGVRKKGLEERHSGKSISTHFGHVPAAEGTLVLAAEHSHAGAALEANDVVTLANGENLHVAETHATGIFIRCMTVGRGRSGVRLASAHCRSTGEVVRVHVIRGDEINSDEFHNRKSCVLVTTLIPALHTLGS